MTKYADKCPHCGRSHPELRGRGITINFVEYEVEDIGDLLLGLVDNVYCLDKKLPIEGVQPTVEFFAAEPTAYYIVLGTFALPYKDIVAEEYQAVCLSLSPDLKPRILVSMDALRDVVRNKLESNIEELNKIMVVAGVDAKMEVLASFSIRHFAAVKVALEFPQAGIKIAFQGKGEAFKGRELLPLLAHYQAMSWVALWFSRYKGGKEASNLGEQFNARFYKGVILQGSAEMALEQLNIIERDIYPRSFHADYSLQAIRACICHLAGVDNLHSRNWVELFFKAELSLRVGHSKARLDMQCLILTQKQARATVPYALALEVIVEILTHGADPFGWFAALDEIATKAGHPGLLGGAIAAINKDDLTRMLRAALEGDGALEALGNFLRQATQGLVDAGRFEDLEHLAQNILDLKPESNLVRAVVYSWLGSSLLQLGQCQRFLNLIGYEVSPWENNLPTKLQIPLWVERSNALRMVEQSIKALALIQVVVDKIGRLEESTDVGKIAAYAVARRNRAILLREAGAPDVAVAELEALLTLDALSARHRVAILNTLAHAYYQIGKSDMMLQCSRKSFELAVEPYDDDRIASEVNLALALAVNEAYGEAIALLSKIHIEIGIEPVNLFVAASAWTTIIMNKGAPRKGVRAVQKIIEVLESLVIETKKSGSLKVCLFALRLLGSIAELSANTEYSRSVWERVVGLCEEKQQPASYIELLPLARNAFRDEDIDLGRSYLLLLPKAFAAYGGQVTDTAAVAVALAPLIRRQLNELVPLIWDACRYEDLRLIAELRRNVVSRSQRYIGEDLSTIERDVRENGLSDDVLSALAPATGSIGVLEWIDCPEWIACFVTIIESTGNVHSHLLEYSDINLDKLATEMHYRLRDWVKDRPGDPFGLPVWRKLERWLIRELSKYMEDDDHLVVIEHGRFTGLPWHVAAAPHWSCSYAGGWTSLLSSLGHGKSASAKTLGVACVPSAHESQAVLTAFNQSVNRSAELAQELGIKLTKRKGKACDKKSFSRLLETVDVCKVLCHGRSLTSTNDVDLVLAYDGVLPTLDRFSTSSRVLRMHEFGWRDGRVLKVSSPTIFLAACSTGLGHVVGIGERVSLLNGLSTAGTRTLVAPRWDAVATSVLPILDDAIRRYLSGMTVAAALRSACMKASENTPQWLAWILSIEGDWR